VVSLVRLAGGDCVVSPFTRPTLRKCLLWAVREFLILAG
jgi:hypothetical protein